MKEFVEILAEDEGITPKKFCSKLILRTNEVTGTITYTTLYYISCAIK